MDGGIRPLGLIVIEPDTKFKKKNYLEHKINKSQLSKLKNYQECVFRMKIVSTCMQTKLFPYKYMNANKIISL